MRIQTHQIDTALEYCLIYWRPVGSVITGPIVPPGANAYNIGGDDLLFEFDDIAQRNRVYRQAPLFASLKKISLRDLVQEEMEHLLAAKWALVGPQAMTVRIPVGRMDYRQLRVWLSDNTTGEVAVLNSAKSRRISFAKEDDYILAKLTFGT